MRIILRLAAFVVIVAVTAYLGVVTWYAPFWPVHFGTLIPIYALGFLICVPAMLYLWSSASRKPPRGIRGHVAGHWRSTRTTSS